MSSLSRAFPQVALLGEEGDVGSADAEYRWVVDPIDGTVNFAYSIPHACVSIALQGRAEKPAVASGWEDGYQSLVGVVYDPFCDELWTAIRGRPARLNGRVIHVSRHRKLGEAIVSIGFAKTRENLEATMPHFLHLVHHVRKLRIMGSAALDLSYVGAGRLDGYWECKLKPWDVAAGQLLVTEAGGMVTNHGGGAWSVYDHRILASNGLIHDEMVAVLTGRSA